MQPHTVIGQSKAIAKVLAQAEQVAGTHSTVLVLGETGTGKELLASWIHEHSDRRTRPMVTVNCAALPGALVESELFGREKGAFTGALSSQIGRFELASGSTLFLDEIGELPHETQAKLLRAVQEKRIERLGNPRSVRIDVRLIVATNVDLEQAVRAGSFRQDLYYRLNVFPIRMPPLRERREDVPQLVWAFVDEFAREMNKPIKAIADDSMAALREYDWPGNVRELRNLVERAMIGERGAVLRIAVPANGATAAREPSLLVDVERAHIVRVLEQCGWRVRGPKGAAGVLGLKPTTLEARMAKLGIRRPGSSNESENLQQFGGNGRPADVACPPSP